MNKIMDIYDGRAIPCSEKHGQIIAKWRALPVGQSFVLINSHDPVRLHNQIAELWPGTIDWKYLVQKPEEFQIQITKLKPLPEVAEIQPLVCHH